MPKEIISTRLASAFTPTSTTLLPLTHLLSRVRGSSPRTVQRPYAEKNNIPALEKNGSKPDKSPAKNFAFVVNVHWHPLKVPPVKSGRCHHWIMPSTMKVAYQQTWANQRFAHVTIILLY